MLVRQAFPSIRSELKKPFEKKLKRARNIIKMLTRLNPSCCVSCSFGKDSVVVLHLVREVLSEVDVLFCNTLCQYPETYKFRDQLVNEWNLSLIETKPKTLWWKVWDKYGLPDGSKKKGKHSTDKCCYYLKEAPFKQAIRSNGWKVNFTGLTALESYQRMLRTCQNGMLYYSSHYDVARVHPIVFWTEQEVWDFIEKENIPLNPAYKNRELQRLGCMICTAHKFWRREIARNNPKLYKWIQERYFHQRLLEGK